MTKLSVVELLTEADLQHLGVPSPDASHIVSSAMEFSFRTRTFSDQAITSELEREAWEKMTDEMAARTQPAVDTAISSGIEVSAPPPIPAAPAIAPSGLTLAARKSPVTAFTVPDRDPSYPSSSRKAGTDDGGNRGAGASMASVARLNDRVKQAVDGQAAGPRARSPTRNTAAGASGAIIDAASSTPLNPLGPLTPLTHPAELISQLLSAFDEGDSDSYDAAWKRLVSLMPREVLSQAADSPRYNALQVRRTDRNCVNIFNWPTLTLFNSSHHRLF